jgi:putative Mn2+ efflux pump MntP
VKGGASLSHSLPSTLKLAVLVLSLGIDTLTVAVALGIAGIGGRDRLRVGISFALFEGGMPLVGLLVGRLVSGVAGDIATYLGIAVLFGVGAWMVYEAVSGAEEEIAVDSWRNLMLTSLSVSLDELAVGFSMGAVGVPVAAAIVLIAAQAFILTWLGTRLGNVIGERLAERAEVVAGIVLAGLAVVLLVEKVT